MYVGYVWERAGTGVRPKNICRSILDAVGDTPLIQLNSVACDLEARILVKLESENPGGSIKDRIALTLIESAERRGELRPGGTIVEATAGNTGVGIAIAAAIKGYGCVCVMPEKMSTDKVRLLKAYGAEVVVTPTDVPPGSPQSYHCVADRLASEIPNAWRSDQFGDPANPEVHQAVTGPEIWEQAGGEVSAFVAGVGTGGTISGVGRYLKRRDPSVSIVAADPVGSLLSGEELAPWKTEGIGGDHDPETFERSIVDRWIRVSDAEAFATARRMAREEGLLVGGSTGAAIAAACIYASDAGETGTIVVLAADTGRNYLSTVFADDLDGVFDPRRTGVGPRGGCLQGEAG